MVRIRRACPPAPWWRAGIVPVLAGGLVACTPGRTPVPPAPTPPADAAPMPAGLIGWGNFGTASNDPQSCGQPANIWMGRFAARPNSWMGQGGGTGQSMVACFPDAPACSAWLGRAIGGAHGVVIIESCTRRDGR